MQRAYDSGELAALWARVSSLCASPLDMSLVSWRRLTLHGHSDKASWWPHAHAALHASVGLRAKGMRQGDVHAVDAVWGWFLLMH